MSKEINEAKAAEIAKRFGVDVSPEEIRRAIKQGFVPESILQGETAVVHKIEGREVEAADINTDPKVRKEIVADIKARIERAKESGIRDPIEQRDVSAEEVCAAYFKGPAGKRFNDPRFHRELRNLERGNPVDYNPESPAWREAEKQVEKEAK